MRLRVIACIKDLVVIEKILTYLARKDAIATAARLRLSPLTGFALAHLNDAPDELGEPIDHCYHDIVGIDYVTAASDPTDLDGGHFEFFTGTKQQAAEQGVKCGSRFRQSSIFWLLLRWLYTLPTPEWSRS